MQRHDYNNVTKYWEHFTCVAGCYKATAKCYKTADSKWETGNSYGKREACIGLNLVELEHGLKTFKMVLPLILPGKTIFEWATQFWDPLQ